MAYELKDMSGSLWPNEKREKDTHPNTTGTIKVDGKEYFISGWTKETDSGKKWISLAIKPKEQRASSGGSPDDDVPFAPVSRGIKGHAY